MSPHSLNHTNQSRVDARTAYFDPIFGENGTPRDNIDVLLQNMVTKLITETSDNGTVMVTGVEVSDPQMSLRTCSEFSAQSLTVVSSRHPFSLSGRR